MNKIFYLFKKNIKIVVLAIAIICFLVYFLSKDTLKKKITYTVVNGTIERAVETNLYVFKNETLVDYDKTLPVTSIVDQGKKAAKNEAIATYKNDSYDDYLSQISTIDKQIQTLIKDLPLTYSADIANIEDKILKYSNEVQKTTSYLKMQEYKAKLDELAYKKINIIAKSTPDSSAIRDLVSKREELTKLSKQSSNIITTPVSGIVTYKVDGLENIYDFTKIEDYTASQLDTIVSKYDMSVNSEFGIKIIDNYTAYFFTKSNRGDNDQYIKEGLRYKIRISDLENKNIRAYLVKNIQDENYNYSLFKIDNEIDELIDYRKLSCEVIWKTTSGMAVPMNAIYTDSEKGYKFVLMVYGAEYVKVPINVVASSDSIAIAENLSKEELDKFELDGKFKLELYDELVIE